MNPEKLNEIEQELVVHGELGGWEPEDLVPEMLAVTAALREAWRERDELRRRLSDNPDGLP